MDTLGALERLVASGRKLILVTGRVLPELLEIFPQSRSVSGWWRKTAASCTGLRLRK